MQNSKLKKMILYLVLAAFNSCGNLNHEKLSVQSLNDSVVSMTKNYSDTTKFKDAITLLNQAILIDSSNIETYKKKFFFESSSGKFKDAISTLNTLIKFKPDSADLFMQRGFFQEIINDTVEAKASFAKGLLLYGGTPSENRENRSYWLNDWKMAAICMIMIGQDKNVHDFLEENCTTTVDSSFYDVQTLSKSKKQLLKEFTFNLTHHN